MLRVLLVLLAAACLARASVVVTKNGPVSGNDFENHRTFLGIPFGQAPIGELRFASPAPALSWAPSVLNATNYGPACPGTIQSAFNLLPPFEQDEDCLYLNVYTPSPDRLTRPLPVMFWIYGGAFALGDAYEFGMYDGSYIASTRDVIIVAANYRLGPFGFLVTEEGANGNQAIEDQRLALQWTIDNIANFGGDPKQITIFGESAGAMSVGIHLVSPLSQGLFQRAICQSNAMGLRYKPRIKAIELGNKLAKSVGCAAGDMVCLRAVDWKKIAFLRGPVLFAGMENIVNDILSWGPTVDGKNLLDQPLQELAKGNFAQVPTIWGFNSHEMGLFRGLIYAGLDALGLIANRTVDFELGPIAYNLLVGFMFKDHADAVKDRYPPSILKDNFELLEDILTEFVFQCPSRRGALHMANQGSNPVLTYEFSHVPQWAPLLERNERMCFVDRSCHAMELPFLFHSEKLLFIPISSRFSEEEEYMSQQMINYWTAFAAGDANGQKPPVQWQAFTEGKQSLLNISPVFSTGSWDTKACDFWDSIGYDLTL